MGLIGLVMLVTAAPATGTPTKAIDSCIFGDKANRFQRRPQRLEKG